MKNPQNKNWDSKEKPELKDRRPPHFVRKPVKNPLSAEHRKGHQHKQSGRPERGMELVGVRAKKSHDNHDKSNLNHKVVKILLRSHFLEFKTLSSTVLPKKHPDLIKVRWWRPIHCNGDSPQTQGGNHDSNTSDSTLPTASSIWLESTRLGDPALQGAGLRNSKD